MGTLLISDIVGTVSQCASGGLMPFGSRQVDYILGA